MYLRLEPAALCCRHGGSGGGWHIHSWAKRHVDNASLVPFLVLFSCNYGGGVL